MTSDSQDLSEWGSPQSKAPRTFLRKLYEMLQEADEIIISWQSNRRSFVIRDSKSFAAEVLPSYFGTTSLASFKRQLVQHGFVRIASGRDGDGLAYYHHRFFKGSSALPALMRGAFTTSRPTRRSYDVSTFDLYEEDNCCDSPLSEKKVSDRCRPDSPHLESTTKNEVAVIETAREIAGSLLDVQRQSTLALPANRGPLQAPRMFVPQPPFAPLKTATDPRKNLYQLKQSAFKRWRKPLVLNPISTQLVFNNWAEKKTTVVPNAKIAGGPSTGTQSQDYSFNAQLSLHEAMLYLA